MILSALQICQLNTGAVTLMHFPYIILRARLLYITYKAKDFKLVAPQGNDDLIAKLGDALCAGFVKKDFFRWDFL